MSREEPRIYTDEAFEHGLRCMDCDRLFKEGDPISQKLAGMVTSEGDDEAWFSVELVCVPCGMGVAA